MNRYKIRLFVLIVSLLICCPGLRAVQGWEVIHSGELRWNLLLADLEKATSYFCPPDTLVTAMKEAAARGVDVRLLLPVKTDLWYMNAANRSFYPDLLAGGIRVFEYLPCFVHSKTFSCDDRICWVSSVNLDNRSLYLSYEVGACFRDEGTAAAEKRWFLGMLEDSREITLQETESWSKARRLKHRLPLLLKHQL